MAADLQLDEQQITTENVYKVLSLVYTTRYSTPPQGMKKFVKKNQRLVRNIFENNSRPLCMDFFKDDLLRTLWAQYDIKDYLSHLDQEVREALINDL